jgi:E3 ubiquitin-protein ligase HUWE1
MESEDYAFYKGLEFLIENKVEDLGYELTFSTEIREFGVTEVRDLIPDGRNIRVSEHNKMDYIRLVCQVSVSIKLLLPSLAVGQVRTQRVMTVPRPFLFES